MIINNFTHFPDFPFEDYYKSPNQFIQAQQYWFEVLHSIPNFIEEEWEPSYKTHPEVKLDILHASMFQIINTEQGKEIALHPNSYAGEVASYMNVNSGYDEEDIEFAKEHLNYTPSEKEIRGISR